MNNTGGTEQTKIVKANNSKNETSVSNKLREALSDPRVLAVVDSYCGDNSN